MRPLAITALLFSITATAGSIPSATEAQQAQNSARVPWGQCCGMGQRPMDHGMTGQGMMGSMPRHHEAMMSGIPVPYASLSNPCHRQ